MGRITVVGVGQRAGELTENAQKALESGARVVLHTGRCPCAAWLKAHGVEFDSLDGLYEAEEDFDAHAERAAEEIIRCSQAEDVVYAVMDVRDRSVAALLARAPVTILPGPPAEDMLFARAVGQTALLEASDWAAYQLQAAQNALVREIDSRQLAGEVKLKLMERYPEDAEVYVRLSEGGVARTPLYNLDRLKGYDHRTSAFVPACGELTQLERWSFEDLRRLVARLRGEKGCPWDREQTHESLRGALIEEAYEVADAIDRGDEAALIEELGDMLFDILLHAEISREHGSFTLEDATSAAAEKMIRRHPHVFSSEGAKDRQAVEASWDELKRREYGFSSRAEAMDGVARALPALKRAEKVLKRAKGAPLPADADPDGGIGAELLRLVKRAVGEGIDAEEALQRATDAYIEAIRRAERASLQ